MLKDFDFRVDEEGAKKEYDALIEEGYFSPSEYTFERHLMIGGIHPENHIETGIYETLTPNVPAYAKTDNIDRHFDNCGVADNIEQVKRHLEEKINDPDNEYAIYYCRFAQANQPKVGGFRWHKWGPYIGDLEPQCEYLYDEDFGPDWQGYVIFFEVVKFKKNGN